MNLSGVVLIPASNPQISKEFYKRFLRGDKPCLASRSRQRLTNILNLI